MKNLWPNLGKAQLDDGVGICVAKNKTLIEVFLFGNCTLDPPSKTP
jgi:hypothetical protein